jgi:hypothetical protein
MVYGYREEAKDLQGRTIRVEDNTFGREKDDPDQDGLKERPNPLLRVPGRSRRWRGLGVNDLQGDL